MAPPDRVTLADVAHAAGVSMMTVSRVLNNRPGAAPAARERVLRTAKALGYTPNLPARSLASGRSHMIGLVVWDVRSSYFTEIVRGVGYEVDAQGYHLVLHTSGPDQEHELAQVATLLGGMIDALLLVLPREADRYIELLSLHRLPCVLVDHRATQSNLPSVRATNLQGAVEGTQHLLALGHQRIGFIAGAPGFGVSAARLDGFRSALGEASLPCAEELVCHGDFSQPSGRACADALLTVRPRPSAIFASSDLMAFGVYQAAQQAGLCIPDDLSVLGFDDIPQAEEAYPPLTTVRQPLFEMGRQAVRMALGLMRGEANTGGSVELPTRLIVRNSTTAPPR